MAKSLRSKVKRDFRSKKRETGIYAATEAARLNRLNAKLASVMKKDKDGDEEITGNAEEPALPEPIIDESKPEDSMDVETSTEAQSKRISTHGPRGSRREEWRLSKGLSAKPKSKGMNRQGMVAAARKSGRSKRRR